MGLGELFGEPAHRHERSELPILTALIERYAEERPFAGTSVVFGHLLVRNSLVVLEALWRGGAEIALCRAHPSPAEAPILADLERLGVPTLEMDRAVQAGDWFLDVGAVLGRRRVPRGAAEVTRTGVLHYAHIACPVVSADDCRAKRIEGFFGTGDAFVRAWRQLRPQESLEGRTAVIFGFGKIGRGVAHRLRRLPMRVIVAEVDGAPRRRAEAEGFAVVDAAPAAPLGDALAGADIAISVTGHPGIIGATYPPGWFRRSSLALVNLGAEDEFGPAFGDDEIVGGRSLPLNFHLAQPTLNRYVDAPLAAHLLALEALITQPDRWSIGVHPLPSEMDDWVVRSWRAAWPEEDLTGIAAELEIEDIG
ncbi:MAG TPA: NAD(P)-dependent oxidoreductase [Anaerolineales bacterium]|nr:NAD(P)-dependent oxidoreductase [Anaerolineales bacterium]